ncbi:hypothetical protein DFR29_10819 [Tahibacter aquaticus]|uniref:Uncharacterized protein n=2 Tax=Tahibacter aquaticus TaxID=520092 RepID=A0A4V3DM12_9GAMM|nr:hypothetical protein DFR29_10819 [Tahibacter aquaticus]
MWMKHGLLENCGKIYLSSLKPNLADENVDLHGVLWPTKFSRGWNAHGRADPKTDSAVRTVEGVEDAPRPQDVF